MGEMDEMRPGYVIKVIRMRCCFLALAGSVHAHLRLGVAVWIGLLVGMGILVSKT